MSDTPAETTLPRPDADLRLKKLVWSTLAALSGLMLGVMVTAFVFHEPLIATSRWFVETFGGPGIAVGFFIPDAFTVPLPNDAFSTFGVLGGMDFWTVVAWGYLGSLIGGSTGYWIGRGLLGRVPLLRTVLERRGGSIMNRIHRGGKVLLAAAALTPLPYSIACWAAGAVRMPFAAFFAISLLRFFRVSVYLWLIEQGFYSVRGIAGQ